MGRFEGVGLACGAFPSVDVGEKIFGGENTVLQQMRTEAALARAQASLGVIPQEACDEIVRKCDVSLIDEDAYFAQLKKTGHPLVCLIRVYSGICEGRAGEYIHYGTTTQDIMDTATMVQLQQAYDVVEEKTRRFRELAAARARAYRDLVMMGRTNDQQALPITLGFKIASWVDEGFVDMGFAPFSSGFPRLVFTPLLVEPCVLLTSRKRYDHYRKLLEEGTCTSGDFVIREKGTKLYEVSMSYLKKQPFYNENRPPHILYNIESIKNFIIEGAGIAILPRCCIEKCLQLDLVAVLPSSLPVGNITYCMIERQNENYNALFRKFRSILLEEQEASAKNTSAK